MPLSTADGPFFIRIEVAIDLASKGPARHGRVGTVAPYQVGLSPPAGRLSLDWPELVSLPLRVPD